ncbi:MAG: hypothetical protein EBR23_09260 [Planctomycetia bacterium]|nr:hypothetical protein [Planctomycetia bacterium]
MTTALTPAQLSAYEARQVEEIAAWKSMRPSHVAQVIDVLASPVIWVVGHVIPRAVVTRLVSKMESIAAQADIPAEVARAANAHGVSDLAAEPLEECDRLACLFSARAERFALAEATVASMGGPLVHIPQQLIAALRSITRIGHCYGYALNGPLDRALVIDVLETAMLQDPEDRIKVVESLHAAVDNHSDPLARSQDLLANATRTMLAEEAVDFVPVVGTAVSFLFDNQFIHSVDVTARRIFQERWLRDHGRVTAIPPAAVPARKSSYEEIGLALGQTMYSVGAVAGFLTGVPWRLIQRAVGTENAVAKGARHGSNHAVHDAREFLGGIRSAHLDAGPDDTVAALPAPGT